LRCSLACWASKCCRARAGCSSVFPYNAQSRVVRSRLCVL
jgi:hypothetical protein